MTDFRELCARMADELDHYRQLLMDDRRETHALATEARAALAQFEPEVPSLRKQAMDELDGIAAVFRMSHGGDLVCDKIRRALEQLPD